MDSVTSHESCSMVNIGHFTQQDSSPTSPNQSSELGFRPKSAIRKTRRHDMKSIWWTWSPPHFSKTHTRTYITYVCVWAKRHYLHLITEWYLHEFSHRFRHMSMDLGTYACFTPLHMQFHSNTLNYIQLYLVKWCTYTSLAVASLLNCYSIPVVYFFTVCHTHSCRINSFGTKFSRHISPLIPVVRFVFFFLPSVVHVLHIVNTIDIVYLLRQVRTNSHTHTQCRTEAEHIRWTIHNLKLFSIWNKSFQENSLCMLWVV